MDMTQIIRFALLGLSEGSLYALVALGVVLVYRSSGVLNFSAGSSGAVAAFTFFELRDEMKFEGEVHWLGALFIALMLGALIGLATQLLVMSLLRRASNVTKLIATLGLLTVEQGVIRVIWGSATYPQPEPIFYPGRRPPVMLFDEIPIPSERLALIAIAIVLAVVLRVAYSKTRFGLATSAVAENRMVASLGGWSPAVVERINFMLAGVLSAFAAICLAPIFGLGLGGLLLMLAIVPALAAALVGRFSSFAITVAAAMIIGAVTSVLRFKLTGDNWKGVSESVPLLVIVLIAVFTGRSRLERGESASRLPLPGNGRVNPILLAVVVAGGVLAVLTADAQWASALLVTFATAIVVLSVVVVTGYTGQLSLTQFALAGVGALVAGRLVSERSWPLQGAILAAIVVTVALGLLVALPSLRTRGVTLAVATLALALMIQQMVLANPRFAGNTFQGLKIENPRFFGISMSAITEPRNYALLSLGLLVASAVMVANIRRGRVGRRLLAVRGNERAAAALGIGVYGAKLYAFAVGAGLAGMAGVLLGLRQGNVALSEFNVFGSITAVQYAVIGGIGWVAGAVVGAGMAVGAVLQRLLGTGLDFSEWSLVISGFILILILAAAPDGVAALITRFAHRVAPWLQRPAKLGDPEPRRQRRPLLVEVSKLTVRFGGVTALDDVTFTIRPGEILGLIGPNGAGKTTLLDTVTGFTKADSGRVLVDGHPVDGWTPEKRARAGISRSWQSVELFEEMTVRENLLVAVDRQERIRYLWDLLWPGRTPRSEVIDEVVADFELEQVMDSRPSSLTQGQARLVGIARAVVSEPSVLFLDEPAAGLDTHESAEIGEVIRRLCRQRGIAVVLVEHDVPLVLSTCDRIVVLDFGSKIAEGTPDEIRSDEAVISAYLGADGDGGSPAAGGPETAETTRG